MKRLGAVCSGKARHVIKDADDGLILKEFWFHMWKDKAKLSEVNKRIVFLLSFFYKKDSRVGTVHEPAPS